MVMPDHVHTIIKLEEGQPLSKVLPSMKLFTAREINKQVSRNGALWQKGYTDWCIRKETTLNKTIRYCYMNPLRKGIVSSPRDYPYWWCKFEMEYPHTVNLAGPSRPGRFGFLTELRDPVGSECNTRNGFSLFPD